MALLSPSRRLRRTVFSEGVEAAGVKAYTVYNHMLLPTVFRSVQEDYHHLKSEVQVWDVSVERQIELKGPDAARLMQMLTPIDLRELYGGQCYYVPIVDETGGMLNDPVAVKISDEHWWVSIADSDLLYWIKGIANGWRLDVLVDEPDVSPLAVQGPKSDDLMADVFGDEVRNIRFFRFKRLEFNNQALIVARSGYSKQGGFEIYVEGTEYADELWEELFTNGKDLNVRPGCPNQIERIESGLLSYGSDMTIQNSPFECGLGRFCEIDANSTCIGSEALENIASNGPSKVLRYFDVKGDKVPFCHDHWPIFNNKKVGEITSGIFSTEFNTNVAIGIPDVEYAIEGTKLQVLIDNKLRDAFVKERPFNPNLKPFI